MKRIAVIFLISILTAGALSGCGSEEKTALTLDKKHHPLPEYVLSSSEIVQETYVLAAEYPEVLASVPCYCNCNESAGHMSNLDCFIKGMGEDNRVSEWDPHGIA